MKRKWLYSEAGLSEVTGLSRTQLKTCRIKGEYRHGKGKGGPVELSERGVQKVLEKFGIQDANLDGARLNFGSNAKSAVDPKQDTPNTVTGLSCGYCGRTFFRARGSEQTDCDMCIAHQKTLAALPNLKLVTVSQLVPNKRILRARNGTGEIYQVIVPSSLVWSIGDPLRVKPSTNHQGYWQLEGKAPRWRGDRMYRLEFV